MSARAKRPAPPAPRWPWDQVELELHEISAIKAMAAQFPAAWAAIVHKIAGADRMSFTAGGEDGRRASDFAEGRRWVGNTLRQVLATRTPGPAGEQPTRGE